MATLPDPYLFRDVMKAKMAEIHEETNAIVEELKGLGQRELAARVLQLSILNHNVNTLYSDMLLAYLNDRLGE